MGRWVSNSPENFWKKGSEREISGLKNRNQRGASERAPSRPKFADFSSLIGFRSFERQIRGENGKSGIQPKFMDPPLKTQKSRF